MRNNILKIGGKTVVFVMLILLTFSGGHGFAGSLEPAEAPQLSGTFIDFWDKGGWNVSQWDAHLKEIKEIGVDTVILHFTENNEYLWFDEETHYDSNHTKTFPLALNNLLQAASDNDMGVMVGLLYDGNYAGNVATDREHLKREMQRCRYLALKIWQAYGDESSFKGWYLPLEPPPCYYTSQNDVYLLKTYYIQPVVKYLKHLCQKPVAMTVFFNSVLSMSPDDPDYDQLVSTSDELGLFMTRLSFTGLDILMLQGGVGAGKCTMDELASYFERARYGLYERGNFNGEFWADIETFTTNGDGYKVSETIDRVIDKLGQVDPYVTRIVNYQFSNNMSGTFWNEYKKPNPPTAEFVAVINSVIALRNGYLNYIGR